MCSHNFNAMTAHELSHPEKCKLFSHYKINELLELDSKENALLLPIQLKSETFVIIWYFVHHLC